MVKVGRGAHCLDESFGKNDWSWASGFGSKSRQLTFGGMMAIFEVGQGYSRINVAEAVGEEWIGKTREGPVYPKTAPLALLFVTLSKSGRSENLKYNDW